MVQSMTGYGREQVQVGNKTISVELRSLNSKGIDLNLKLPGQYREKELDARNYIAAKLERGKVDAFIHIQNSGEVNFEVNTEVVKKYHTQVKALYNDLGYTMDGKGLATIFRFPEAITTGNNELDEQEWSAVQTAIEKACVKLAEFRLQEGKKLEADMRKQVASILEKLEIVKQFEGERLQAVKDRLIKNLGELQSKENYDKNRFEQELIYYLEKLDINEEKVRLKAHCDYFIKTMESENTPGRKLGFIAQEMGREINTLGSKCNHAEIQKLVVVMKDDLEKIKEQCLNIL